MKKTATGTQIVRNFLQIGDEIQLRVGHNPKHNRADFIPQFVEDDNILWSSSSWYGGSIRIFIPNKPVQLETGEIWNAKVVAYNIGNGITKDARAYIYINVDVLSREEYLEHDPNFVAMKFFIRKKSGDRVLEKKSVTIEVVPEKFYRDRNKAVKVRLYTIAGKVFDIGGGEYFSREKFILDFTKTIGKSANAVSLSKAFDKLPELPEVVDFQSINF